jgi:capsular exopolysaccharide synthesis family protein
MSDEHRAIELSDRVSWRARRLAPERPVYVPPAAPAATPSDFVETLRKLLRYRFLILLCGVAGALAAIAFALSMPPRYRAEARVLVGVPTPRALDITAIISDTTPDAERVQSEMYAVQSRDLAKDVIDRLGLASSPEFNPSLPQPPSLPRQVLQAIGVLHEPADHEPAETVPASGTTDQATTDQATIDRANKDRMVDALLAKLNVSALGRSNVISIEAEATKPDVAARLANTMAEQYLERQRTDRAEAAHQVETFLAGRIAELRQQVEKSEQAVEDYRRSNGLYKGASSGITSQQMTELNTQLILAQTQKAEADARLGEAQTIAKSGGAGDSVPDALRSPLIQALKEQQSQAERNLAELQQTYGPNHPKIISTKAEAADINRKLQLELSRITEGLHHEASSATARYDALRRSFDDLQSKMGIVNEKSIRLEALERDATVNRNLLENMLNRAKETVGQQELQQANAKMISSAAPPARPAFPPKSLLVILGTLGGALLGLALALLRDGADRTFRRSDQVETITGLPVLAMVPTVRDSVVPSMHVLKRPVSPFSEAVRKLNIGLQMSEASWSPKTVLFASATPGEGKSILAAALGRMLAANGRRILLVDCDWRAPSLHRLFRVANRGGLAAMLEGDASRHAALIHRDEASGVDVLPSGNFTLRSMHRLMEPGMRQLIDQLADAYDLVILDGPPVLVGAEALTLGQLVDKIVYAVRWGVTRREVALEGLKQFIETHGDIAGIVLSRVDAKRYRQYGYGRLDYEYPRKSLPQPS